MEYRAWLEEQRRQSTANYDTERFEGSEQIFALLVLNTECSRFLIAAREEPGIAPELGCILLGPTLQASRGSYEQVDGDMKPPRLKLYKDHRVLWYQQAQDGKSVRIGTLVIRDQELSALETLSGEYIMTVMEFSDALQRGECNSLLVQAVMYAMVEVLLP